MENAVDALKIAGSVLLFVLALSIVVVVFTQARETADIVLSFSDRESSRIDENESYYYLGNNNTKREVGIETIIPTLYRAYKENYKIIFEFNDNTYFLFKNKSGEVNKIDLREQTIGSDQESRDFLQAIIYGNYNNYKKNENESNETAKINFKNRYSITEVNDKCLYKHIVDFAGTITESLGTYYMEEVKNKDEEEIQTGTTDENAVEEVNKNEKRVITYTFTSI